MRVHVFSGEIRIRYIISDGEVRLLKARSVMELEGILRRSGQKPVSLEEMEQAIGKGALEGSR